MSYDDTMTCEESRADGARGHVDTLPNNSNSFDTLVPGVYFCPHFRYTISSETILAADLNQICAGVSRVDRGKNGQKKQSH